MSLASSQQSFLANALSSSSSSSSSQKKLKPSKQATLFFSCRHDQEHHKDLTGKRENRLAKVAVVTLAAGVLTLGSVSDAYAAKSGGRVGGQAFRPSAPRSGPRINNNNSRTNIYINPRVAPPLGGYGYGSPFFGGWGWSPFSFFAPGPGVVVGVGGGFDSLAFFLFLGAAAAVARRFSRSRRDDDEDEDY